MGALDEARQWVEKQRSAAPTTVERAPAPKPRAGHAPVMDATSTEERHKQWRAEQERLAAERRTAWDAAHPKSICSVEGCDRLTSSHDLCHLHYERVKRNGDTDLRRLPAMANPWRGTHLCPSCGSSDWTLPWYPGKPLWHCCSCSEDFTPADKIK